MAITPVSEFERTCGDNIRRGRKLVGLTQDELAKKVGVRQPTVARWEKGRVPDDRYKVRIAEVLRQDVRQLFPLTRAVMAS